MCRDLWKDRKGTENARNLKLQGSLHAGIFLVTEEDIIMAILSHYLQGFEQMGILPLDTEKRTVHKKVPRSHTKV